MSCMRCRSNSTSLARSVSRRSSISEQADAELESMSAICPLTDEYLPLDAGNLKNKQVCTAMLTCMTGSMYPQFLPSSADQHNLGGW